MTDEEAEYLNKMRYYNDQLTSLHNRIQMVADRLGNGARMSYPNPYKNAELFELQDRLLKESELVLTEMERLLSDASS